MSSRAHRIRTSQYIYQTVEENDSGLFRGQFLIGKLLWNFWSVSYPQRTAGWGAIHNTSRSHFSPHRAFTSQCSSHYNNIRAGSFLCPIFGCVGVQGWGEFRPGEEKWIPLYRFLRHIPIKVNMKPYITLMLVHLPDPWCLHLLSAHSFS